MGSVTMTDEEGLTLSENQNREESVLYNTMSISIVFAIGIKALEKVVIRTPIDFFQFYQNTGTDV